MAGVSARLALPKTKVSNAEAPARTPGVDDLADGADSAETAWWRTVAIGGAALALALATLALVWLLAKPLALLIAATVIAAALAPIVNALERWLPRAMAVITLYIGLIVIVGSAGWFFAPALIAQGRDLFDQTPDLVTRGRHWLDRLDPIGGDEMVLSAESGISRFASLLVALPMRIFSSLLEFILVLFMSAYWLISGPALRAFALSLFPNGRREKTNRILDDMTQTMGGYVRATFIDGMVIGLVVYIGLRLIGVDYPIVLALIAAAGEFIPIVGPILASVPAVGIALLDSPTQGLIVLIFYLVLQQIESNVLLPNIMKNQTDIPPLLSLFALFAGSALGGLLGALIAIPVAGALRILVVRVLAPAEQEWVGSDGEPSPS